MPQTLDIHKVISDSTANVSLDDLNKKGFKQVKVLNQSLISRLISEAVDHVLEERSREISKDEREKVIKEARSHFETLAKRRLEKERSRIDDLEKENASLLREVEELKSRQAGALEIQAERDQALLRLQVIETELSHLKGKVKEQDESLAQKKVEVTELRADQAARRAEVEQLSARLKDSLAEAAGKAADLAAREAQAEARAVQSEKRLNEVLAELQKLRARAGAIDDQAKQTETEVARLRSSLAEVEKRATVAEQDGQSAKARLAELDVALRTKGEEASSLREKLASTEKSLSLTEGLLQAKSQEIEKLAAQSSPPGTEKILSAISERLEQMGRPSDVSQIMLTLDSLSRKLANLGSGEFHGGRGEHGKELNIDSLFFAGSEGKVDSNVSKVTVKQAKAGDVRGALAKLKKLQQGGEDGE